MSIQYYPRLDIPSNGVARYCWPDAQTPLLLGVGGIALISSNSVYEPELERIGAVVGCRRRGKRRSRAFPSCGPYWRNSVAPIAAFKVAAPLGHAAVTSERF